MDKTSLFAVVALAMLPALALAWDLPPDPKTSHELRDATALALARVCVNEEGWDSPDGCAAIWNVALNVRSSRCAEVSRGFPVTLCRKDGRPFPAASKVPGSRETALSALRRLSRRTTGMVPPTTQRLAWTSTLQDSSQPPTNWRECGSLPAGAPCYGTWRRYAGPWRRVREHARNLVASGRRAPQCGSEGRRRVIAWGGEMDHWLAVRRGLVELDCGETRNRFYSR